jgi:hypothetical protein
MKKDKLYITSDQLDTSVLENCIVKDHEFKSDRQKLYLYLTYNDQLVNLVLHRISSKEKSYIFLGVPKFIFTIKHNEKIDPKLVSLLMDQKILVSVNKGEELIVSKEKENDTEVKEEKLLDNRETRSFEKWVNSYFDFTVTHFSYDQKEKTLYVWIADKLDCLYKLKVSPVLPVKKKESNLFDKIFKIETFKFKNGTEFNLIIKGKLPDELTKVIENPENLDVSIETVPDPISTLLNKISFLRETIESFCSDYETWGIDISLDEDKDRYLKLHLHLHEEDFWKILKKFKENQEVIVSRDEDGNLLLTCDLGDFTISTIKISF